MASRCCTGQGDVGRGCWVSVAALLRKPFQQTKVTHTVGQLDLAEGKVLADEAAAQLNLLPQSRQYALPVTVCQRLKLSLSAPVSQLVQSSDARILQRAVSCSAHSSCFCPTFAYSATLMLQSSPAVAFARGSMCRTLRLLSAALV